MAATVQNLRDILLNVEPPKILVDRATEIPILREDLLQRLKKATTREEGIAISEEAKLDMAPEADEVYPNIFIGNYKAVNTVEFLKSKGITHIFNSAEGTGPGMVPAIDPATLDGIKYHAMSIHDNVDAKDDGAQIRRFIEAADVINDILNQNNAKIIVNCFSGISRSSCCVLVYLICHKGLTAGEALTMIKKKRDAWPSNENLAHVAKLSNEKHGFEVESVIDDDVKILQWRAITRKPEAK